MYHFFISLLSSFDFFSLIIEEAKILDISSASFKILISTSSFLSNPSLNKHIQYFDSLQDLSAIS